MEIKIWPEELMAKLTSAVGERVLSAGDLMQRKHPILPHYRVGEPMELARAVTNCLLALPDEDKKVVIDILQKFMKKD